MKRGARIEDEQLRFANLASAFCIPLFLARATVVYLNHPIEGILLLCLTAYACFVLCFGVYYWLDALFGRTKRQARIVKFLLSNLTEVNSEKYSFEELLVIARKISEWQKIDLLSRSNLKLALMESSLERRTEK